jgi:hypothetical protein
VGDVQFLVKNRRLSTSGLRLQRLRPNGWFQNGMVQSSTCATKIKEFGEECGEAREAQRHRAIETLALNWQKMKPRKRQSNGRKR